MIQMAHGYGKPGQPEDKFRDTKAQEEARRQKEAQRDSKRYDDRKVHDTNKPSHGQR